MRPRSRPTRWYAAYREAAKAFTWYEKRFAEFTIEQCEKIAEESTCPEQRRTYGMLAKAKAWRLKYEDPEVLDACELEKGRKP